MLLVRLMACMVEQHEWESTNDKKKRLYTYNYVVPSPCVNLKKKKPRKASADVTCKPATPDLLTRARSQRGTKPGREHGVHAQKITPRFRISKGVANINWLQQQRFISTSTFSANLTLTVSTSFFIDSF